MYLVKFQYLWRYPFFSFCYYSIENKRHTSVKHKLKEIACFFCFLIIKLCIGSITKESTLLLLLKVIHFIQQRQTKIPILFSFNFSSTNSNWKHMSSYVIFASMQKVSINLIIVHGTLLVLGLLLFIWLNKIPLK